MGFCLQKGDIKNSCISILPFKASGASGEPEWKLLSLSLSFCILNPFRQRAGGGGGGNFSIAARSLLSGRLQTPEPNALLLDILMHQEKFSKVKSRLDLEKKKRNTSPVVTPFDLTPPPRCVRTCRYNTESEGQQADEGEIRGGEHLCLAE